LQKNSSLLSLHQMLSFLPLPPQKGDCSWPLFNIVFAQVGIMG